MRHGIRREGRILDCVMERITERNPTSRGTRCGRSKPNSARGVSRKERVRLRVERIAAGMSSALHKSYREESKDLLRESLKLIRKDRYV